MHTAFRLGDGVEASACYRWAVVGVPRAVVVLAHGMGEHALRYERLAAALAGQQIETYALDHRGHGRTATDAGQFGVLGPRGWTGVVDDYARLVAHARSQHGGVPIVALGHSMGSFVVQQFLLDHCGEVSGAALSGSAALDQVKVIVDPTVPLDLALLNAPFMPARTDFDWLSRDEAEVDAYVGDPLCGFGLDAEALVSWLATSDRLADPAALAAIPTGFPLALIAGGDDPVNARYAWLDLLADRYSAAGLSVTKMYYESARHEVFNETNRDEITSDLLTWLALVVAQASASTP